MEAKPGPARRQSNTLGMIAGRCRNDPAFADFAQLGLDLKRRAANLERPGYLKIFQFQIDLEPGEAAERGRVYQRRSDYVAFDDGGRSFDLGRRNHDSYPSSK